MSSAPFYTHEGRWGIKTPALELHGSLARGRTTAGGLNHPVQGGMIETAENLRRRYGITREAQDALAPRSQQRTSEAIETDRFGEQIVPVEVSSWTDRATIRTDEHPRPGTTAEQLAAPRPMMIAADPAATVTAGNATGPDGRRPRSRQRQRLQDLAGPSSGCDEGKDRGHAGSGDMPQAGAIRPRDDVHRRRPEPSGRLRARHFMMHTVRRKR